MKNLGYSQNFLVNKKLVERLISKSNIDVTDYVIEIGPGKGIITDVLSQHAGEVVAVEYDQELYNNLVRYHSHDNVTYIFGDFLKYKKYFQFNTSFKSKYLCDEEFSSL